MKTIISMYITLMPTLLAGIGTMIWCKLPILESINVPLDEGKCLIDKKRIFGDNKTYKGLVGYIVMNVLMSIIWFYLCKYFSMEKYNLFFVNYPNTFWYALLVGVLLGLAYSLFELPNSFLKRRFDIKEGKSAEGKKKIIFFILDQTDSLLGRCAVVCFFYKMSSAFYLGYIMLGAVTHIVCNVLLYSLKLRRNIF